MHPFREMASAIDRLRVQLEKLVNQGGQCCSDVFVSIAVPGEDQGAKGSMALQRLSEEPEEANSVPPGVKAVQEPSESFTIVLGVELQERLVGLGT
jgi:hypothetical protein